MGKHPVGEFRITAVVELRTRLRGHFSCAKTAAEDTRFIGWIGGPGNSRGLYPAIYPVIDIDGETGSHYFGCRSTSAGGLPRAHVGAISTICKIRNKGLFSCNR